MFRLIAAAAFALMTAPAWAGCSNFTDGSLKTAAPRAEICIGDACESTAADFQCGNASGAQYGYANGLRVSFGEGDAVSASMNKVPVDYAKITCRDIDEGACFPTKN